MGRGDNDIKWYIKKMMYPINQISITLAHPYSLRAF
jgi:hypothetical protein